jgi:tryptophan synthase beta subunit
MSVVSQAVSVKDVEDAARRIRGKVQETPLLSAGELSRRVGARVLLKAENLQRTAEMSVLPRVASTRPVPRRGSWPRTRA